MARPRTNRITVRHVPGRPSPWGAFWRETRPNGHRGVAQKYFATEAEAVAFKQEVEAAAAALPPPPPTITAGPAEPPIVVVPKRGRILFRSFAEEWLRDIVSRRKPSTQRSYEQILRVHVYPVLATTAVGAVGSEHCVRVVAEAAASGASWGTQKAIIRVLSTLLRWAVKFQHLRQNPALGLCKELKDDSSPDYADPEPNPLTPEQAEAFLTWVATGRVPGSAADRPVDGPRLRGGQLRTEGYPEWSPYFYTLLRTGMRRGEAAALKWSTVFLDRTPPRARLEQSYSPSARAAAMSAAAGDVALKGKRPHEIDLAPALVDVLRGLARTRREEALKAVRKVSPYVFLTPRGTRVLSDSATAERIFQRGMEALDLAHAGHTIHDLRDTFATSHLLQDPGRLFWVSWMLGHRQTSTTLNRYTKWVPTLVTGAAYAAALDPPRGREAEAKVEAGTGDADPRK